VVGDRELLKQSFQRVAILSNEKFRGVRVQLGANEMRLTTNNQEHEQADERVEVEYSGAEMEIGFNINYVVDVLNSIDGEGVKFTLTDENSSALVEDNADDSALYVIMPMRL